MACIRAKFEHSEGLAVVDLGVVVSATACNGRARVSLPVQSSPCHNIDQHTLI